MGPLKGCYFSRHPLVLIKWSSRNFSPAVGLSIVITFHLSSICSYLESKDLTYGHLLGCRDVFDVHKSQSDCFILLFFLVLAVFSGLMWPDHIHGGTTLSWRNSFVLVSHRNSFKERNKMVHVLFVCFLQDKVTQINQTLFMEHFERATPGLMRSP